MIDRDEVLTAAIDAFEWACTVLDCSERDEFRSASDSGLGLDAAGRARVDAFVSEFLAAPGVGDRLEWMVARGGMPAVRIGHDAVLVAMGHGVSFTDDAGHCPALFEEAHAKATFLNDAASRVGAWMGFCGVFVSTDGTHVSID